MRIWTVGAAFALGWAAPTGARAQGTGSGADLLDISRRAAVVDQVLDDHLERMRRGRVFGTHQRLRMATNLSYYGVSKLALTTEDEGTFPVALSRAYTGFLVEVLEKPSPEGEPGERIFYVTGGGLAYGLNRPYVLPLPEAELTTDSKSDLEGTQYSDEQYTAGARWRGFEVTGSWVRGQMLEATDDGRADGSTLDTRYDRAQVVVDSPIGLRASTRWAVGGAVENVTVGLRVNDAVAEAVDAEPSGKVPVLTVGFRKSDYAGSEDRRSHPRLLGAGLTEDLAWLFGEPRPSGAFTARVAARADADLAARRLQLAVGEAELGWTGWGEISVDAGISWYQDDALATIIGTTATPGFQAGFHLGGSARYPCPKDPPPDFRCIPNLGLRMVLSYQARQSWADELRYVAEYAGKPQHYVYVEFLGGV